jgi:hypothetical protein
MPALSFLNDMNEQWDKYQTAFYLFKIFDRFYIYLHVCILYGSEPVPPSCSLILLKKKHVR